MRERARKIEALGYSTLLVPQHLGEQLSPVPAMMLAAEATEHLRVGSLVFNCDQQHPAMLAHVAATLDLLTDGRLELGLGAGWFKPDYDLIRVPFDPPSVRIARLEEAVTILKRLLSEGFCSFDGRYYRIQGAIRMPETLQRPHPPILIGGGGRRLLSLAAREADIIDLAPRRPWPGRVDPFSITARATVRKLDWIRKAAGSRVSGVEFSIYPALAPVTVTDSWREAVAHLAENVQGRYPGPDISMEQLISSPHVLFGSVDRLTRKLVSMREQFGISYIRVDHAAIDQFAPVVARLAGT